MRIRTKIFLSVVVTAAIFVFVVLFFLGGKYKNTAYQDAEKIADLYALQTATEVKGVFDTELSVIRTLANSVGDLKELNLNNPKNTFNSALYNILKSKPKYLSTNVSWELSAINPDFINKPGRKRYAFFKESSAISRINQVIDILDTAGYKITGMYYKIKIAKEHEFLINPYYGRYDLGTQQDSILMTSLVEHVLSNNKYVGLVGIDFSLSELQNIVKSSIPYKGSYIFLLANDGTIVVHPNKDLIGKKATKLFPDKKDINIVSKIALGKKFNLGTMVDNPNAKEYITFAPFYAGNTKSPWLIGVYVPINEVAMESIRNRDITIYVGILGFLMLISIVYIIASGVSKSLTKAIKTLQKLDKGNLDKANKLPIKHKDEIGLVGISVNNLIDTLNRTADFAIAVGEGNYETDFYVVDENDKLGNALIEMRKNLNEAEIERQKRLIENEKRSWAQTGISEVGEILQRNYQNTGELSYQLISNIVKYIGATQGGIFFTEKENNNEFIVLKAAYAFDRKKKLEAKVQFGESLVGRCAQEQELIYLSDVPQGYTYISSGLGDETPSVLLLSPLMYENQLFGVIEIASFTEIEKYKIDFVVAICERIASVIANIQINTETAALLEQSRKQSEELSVKEEETAKTISELQKIQREILQRDNEAQGIMQALIATASVIFYDMNGKITEINDKNLVEFGYSINDLIGRKQSNVFHEPDKDANFYAQFWTDLRNGKSRTKEFHLVAGAKERWVLETFSPIYGTSGIPEKVINIGVDITTQKLLERKLKTDNGNGDDI